MLYGITCSKLSVPSLISKKISDDFPHGSAVMEVKTTSDGSIVVISIPLDDDARGKVYIFEKQYDGEYSLADTLTSPIHTDIDDQFGKKIAVSKDGKRLAVSGTNENKDGVVFVYENFLSWTLETTLEVKASKKDYPAKYFGESLAFDSYGSTLVVGYPDKTHKGRYSVGEVHVFERSKGAWGLLNILQPKDPIEGMQFGSSVSIDSSSNTLLVGASYATNNPEIPKGKIIDGGVSTTGAVYLYENISNKWTLSNKLVVVNDPLEIMLLGRSVTISASGTTMAASGIIVAKSNIYGVVIVWKLKHGSWVKKNVITSDIPFIDSGFGNSISLNESGDVLVISNAVRGESATDIYICKKDSWSYHGRVLNGVSSPIFKYCHNVCISDDDSVIVSGNHIVR